MKSFYMITQCALCGTRFHSQEAHTDEQVETSRRILRDMGGTNLLDLHDCGNGNKGTLIIVGYALVENIEKNGVKQ